MIKATRDGQEMQFEDSNEVLVFLVENMAMKSDLEALEVRVVNIETTMATKEDIKLLTTRIDGIETSMATKEDLTKMATKEDLGKQKYEFMDFVENKLAKLRFDIQGDIVTQSRKEDGKLTGLIEILMAKHVLSAQEAGALLRMEPFPRSTM